MICCPINISPFWPQINPYFMLHCPVTTAVIGTIDTIEMLNCHVCSPNSKHDNPWGVVLLTSLTPPLPWLNDYVTNCAALSICNTCSQYVVVQRYPSSRLSYCMTSEQSVQWDQSKGRMLLGHGSHSRIVVIILLRPRRLSAANGDWIAPTQPNFVTSRSLLEVGSRDDRGKILFKFQGITPLRVTPHQQREFIRTTIWRGKRTHTSLNSRNARRLSTWPVVTTSVCRLIWH